MHQHELISMSSEILLLWWWDPPPGMIKRSGELRNQNFAANQHYNTPSAKPFPIHHHSRSSTTFSTKQPTLTSGARNQRVVDLGPVFFGIPTHPDWLMDEMLPTDGDEGLTKEDLQRVDDSIMAGPLTSEVCTETEDSDDISDSMAVRDKPTICLSSLDIMSWSQNVVNAVPEPVLTSTSTSTSFERGVIPSMSVNDILMVKGLITPPVYLQFFDLSLFSCL